MKRGTAEGGVDAFYIRCTQVEMVRSYTETGFCNSSFLSILQHGPTCDTFLDPFK